MRAFLLLSSLTVCAAAVAADAPPAATPSSAAPAGAEVYFITPKDGETVSGDVVVRFGLKGMGVAPAGIQMPNTCHHHMLVDADDVPAADKPMGKDDHHMHFGGGQTETTVKLAAGKHTLQLVCADYLHVPFKPSVASPKITVTVK